MRNFSRIIFTSFNSANGLYIISEIFKQIDLICLKFAAKYRLFQLLLLFYQLIFVLLQPNCICLTVVITVRRVLSR